MLFTLQQIVPALYYTGKDIGHTVISIIYYYTSQIVTLVPPYVAVHFESGYFT